MSAGGERRRGERGRVVLFVGLQSLYERLAAESPDGIRAVQASDVELALRSTRADSPAVVVVDATNKDEGPVDFASICRMSQPDFRAPIIMVDPRDGSAGIVINEWDEQHGVFYERSAPLQFLKSELRSALKIGEEEDGFDPDDQETIEELMDLGRNEYVRSGDKMFNVQTEVRVAETITIVSQIFDGGAIIDNGVQVIHRGEGDLAKRVSRIAGMQHYEAVAKVRRGRFG